MDGVRKIIQYFFDFNIIDGRQSYSRPTARPEVALSDSILLVTPSIADI